MALILVPGLLGAQAQVVPPTDAELRQCVSGALSFYNDHSQPGLFPLTQDQLDQLMEGEVIRVQRKLPTHGEADGDIKYHERLTAYILVHQPMEQLWAASLDPEFNSSSMLTEYRIAQVDSSSSQWYQHLNLPWPVNDRHWVIDLELNTRLRDLASNAIRERSWCLAEDGPSVAHQTVGSNAVQGLTSENVEGAVYVPMNQGGWVMFRLSENSTLIAYHVSTSFGGMIPESIVNSLGARLVNGLLNGVVEYSLAASAEPGTTPDPGS